MEKKERNTIKEENMDIKDIVITHRYPFLGFSPSLIDYFLLIGYDIISRKEIVTNVFKNQNQLNRTHTESFDRRPSLSDLTKEKENNFPPFSFNIESKPVVINSIGSDFTEATLDEEIIVNRLFPNKSIPIYFEEVKDEQVERKELPIQNNILYLKANNIFELDDAAKVKDDKLKNDVMFNVLGFLFWDPYITEGDDKKKYKLYFPKVFAVISQYPYFQYYSFLCQNILNRIRNGNFQIPLEVQLYNIINYTPSPINSPLLVELLFNKDVFLLKKEQPQNEEFEFKIKKNSDNNEYKNDKNIYLNQLSGFPYLDINIASIFSFMTSDTLIIVYIFSFLEFKCLFFHPSLDILNNIMYIINTLLYPFNDISETGQIYSVSKEEILDKNKIINNYITGVNCAYDEKTINLPEAYNEYIIISVSETNSLEMFYKGENMIKEDLTSDVWKLFDYIKTFLSQVEDNKKSKSFLESKLIVLMNEVNNHFAKYVTLLENIDEKSKEIFFKQINSFNEPTYKYTENEENNFNIQKLFYGFNISVMQYFHGMIKLEESNKAENELKDNRIKAYYELKFKEENKDDNFIFNDEDKIFLNFFRKTKKFNEFINIYIKENKCQEIKRPIYIIAEEFMNLPFDEKRDYTQIINKFYQTSNKLKKISYNKFYIYYMEHFAKSIFEFAHEAINMNAKEKSNNKENIEYVYTLKENILDNNILQRYSYLLNNMDPKKLYENFPNLKFKLEDNSLDEIRQNLFSDAIEANLLENKYFNVDDVLSFTVLTMYIINLKKNKIIYHFFEEIMKSKLITKKNLIRKYIYFIINILNENVREKIKSKQNYIQELLYYKEIMSCLLIHNQKYNLNSYYPNELSDIIQNFNYYQNYYNSLLKNNPKMEAENNKIFEQYQNYENGILKEGVDYKLFLQNNACEDKGAIKDEVLMNIAEALEYRGHIQTTCKTCKFKIKPNLFFIYVPNDRCSNVGFYSLIYSFKNASKILMRLLNNKDKGTFEEDYFGLCANMIFYINYKLGMNNSLSRFIATTIKKSE